MIGTVTVLVTAILSLGALAQTTASAPASRPSVAVAVPPAKRLTTTPATSQAASQTATSQSATSQAATSQAAGEDESKKFLPLQYDPNVRVLGMNPMQALYAGIAAIIVFDIIVASVLVMVVRRERRAAAVADAAKAAADAAGKMWPSP